MYHQLTGVDAGFYKRGGKPGPMSTESGSPIRPPALGKIEIKHSLMLFLASLNKEVAKEGEWEHLPPLPTSAPGDSSKSS